MYNIKNPTVKKGRAILDPFRWKGLTSHAGSPESATGLHFLVLLGGL